MCEGPHDSAFLSLILHANRYKTLKKKLAEYPKYIKNFIIQHITGANVEDLALANAKNDRIIPSYALYQPENENHIVLIFNLGGDSCKAKRETIIKSFDNLFEAAEDSIDFKLSIIYFFDADKQGVESRLKAINKELQEILGEVLHPNVDMAKYIIVKKVKYGAYIFFDQNDNEKHGRLEDYVLPLIKRHNEDIYNDIYPIIDRRNTYNIFVDSKVSYDRQKMTIGMMGQLAKPGSATPAIIEQSGMINKEDVKNDSFCKEIFQFINSSFE